MKRVSILLSLATLTFTSVMSQSEELQCIATYPEEKLKILKSIEKDTSKNNDGRQAISSYPVTVYMIRQSDGTGGLTEEDFEPAFENLQDKFSGTDISFFICGEIHTINSDTYFDLTKSEENSLFNTYHTENTINLYVPNTVSTGSGNTICGHADFPGWGSNVVLSAQCANDGTTISHEFGHIFGLRHTHGNSNVSMTDELASTQNCAVAGDDVCDTPADPNLYGKVDTFCTYFGNEVDDEGNPFEPSTSNIMSYTPKHCASHFTAEQIAQMEFAGKFLRSDLQCPVISADFTASPLLTLCDNSVLVQFQYTGSGATSFAWDVDGDGVTDYTSSSPLHTYSSTGNFDVTLTVEDGSNTIKKSLPSVLQILDQQEGPYFDTTSILDGPIAILNPDGKYTWKTKYLGPQNPYGQSWVMDNYHYHSYGQEDAIILGPFDLQTLSNPYFTFDVSYAPYSSSRSDGLQVSISTNCGETYEVVYNKSGLELSTTGSYQTQQWLPLTASDWRTENIDLSDFNTPGSSITIKLTNVNDFGNNLYLDNIDIGGQPPLPVTILSFQGKTISSDLNILSWETAAEINITEYIIEFSEDGFQFAKLATAPAQNAIHNVYKYYHHLPGSSMYYRLRVLEQDGSEKTSRIIHLRNADVSTWKVYPNPVASTLFVQVSEAFSESSLKIFNRTGELVMSRPFSTDPNTIIEVPVESLQPGLYSLLIGNHQTQRFLKVD